MSLEAITLSVDAMGGDYGPGVVVRGAIQFLRDGSEDNENVTLLLVGDEVVIRDILTSEGAEDHPSIEIVHTSEEIGMCDHPMQSVRAKPNASLVVAAKLVAEGRASATVSAGNTGACLVAAIQYIGRIDGVARPAIAAPMPTATGRPTLLMDAGANVDCQLSHLVQFGILGSVYAERVFGRTNPSVALLSNGEEDTKGNQLTKAVRAALEAAPINFIGCTEGNHVLDGVIDVVVCDGFDGNVLVKGVEGMASVAISVLKDVIAENPDQPILHEAVRRVAKRVDYAEIGGAPLIGIKGISIIAHGRSNAYTMMNAIRAAVRAGRSGVVEKLVDAGRIMSGGASS